MSKMKTPEGYGNETNYHNIFNDNNVDINEDFKLMVAIETNEVRFNFYNLRTKEFSDNINIQEPFLVNTRMCSWNLLENHLKLNTNYDNYFNYYSFNRELGKKINKYLKTEIKFPIVEKEKFKEFKKLFITNTCKTKEQVKALVRYLRACTTQDYAYYDNDKGYELHYILKFMGNKLTHSKVMKLREDAINLEVNVNFGYYYKLIKEKLDKGEILNNDAIKNFIISNYSDSAIEFNNLRNVVKNSNSFTIHLHQHDSYLKILDKKKNTLNKVKKLLEINPNLNSNLIPSVVINKNEFIDYCIKKNYRKPLLTHQLLNNDSDFIFNYLSQDKKFFKTEFMTDLPIGTKKKIKLDAELSSRISLMIVNNANKVYKLLMLYEDNNIEKFNNELNNFIEKYQIPDKKIVRNYIYRHLRKKGEITTEEQLIFIIQIMLNNTRLLFKHLKSNAFTLELFNSFIQFRTLKVEENINFKNVIIKNNINDIKTYFYQKDLFKKFPMKIRKNYELEAINQDPININYCSLSTRKNKEFILLATKNSFLNINYNISFEKLDLNLFSKILENNLECMYESDDNFVESSCLEYKKYSEAFLNEEIKEFMEQSGFANRLNNFKLKDGCLTEYITTEDVKNLLKACKYKIMNDKYTEKSIKPKLVKI